MFVTFGEPRALITKDKGSIPLVGGARARVECGAVLVHAIGGADVFHDLVRTHATKRVPVARHAEATGGEHYSCTGYLHRSGVVNGL